MDTLQPRQTVPCSLQSGWEQVQTSLVNDDYTVVTKQHLDTHNTNAYHVYTLKLYNFLSFFSPLTTGDKEFSRNMDQTSSWMESTRAGGVGWGDVEHRPQNHLTKFSVEYKVGTKRDGETNVLVPMLEKITCRLLQFRLPCLRTANRRNFLNSPPPLPGISYVEFYLWIWCLSWNKNGVYVNVGEVWRFGETQYQFGVQFFGKNIQVDTLFSS